MPATPLIEIAGTGSSVDQQSRRITLLGVDTATLRRPSGGSRARSSCRTGWTASWPARCRSSCRPAAGHRRRALALLVEDRVPASWRGGPPRPGPRGRLLLAVADLGSSGCSPGSVSPPASCWSVSPTTPTGRPRSRPSPRRSVAGARSRPPRAARPTSSPSPSAAALQAGFLAALAVAAVEVVLAVVLALVLGAPARARLLGCAAHPGLGAREAVAWSRGRRCRWCCSPPRGGLRSGSRCPASCGPRWTCGPSRAVPTSRDRPRLAAVMAAVAVGSAAVIAVAVLVAGTIARRLSRDRPAHGR
jgi:hypothetical protein